MTQPGPKAVCAAKVTGKINPDTGLAEPLAAGTQVFFWKKGTIQDVDGSLHDTWWLVDNGLIGDDGMARTSSPPYSGITGDGGFFVLTKATGFNADTGEIQVDGGLVNYNAIWAQMAIIAMMPTPYFTCWCCIINARHLRRADCCRLKCKW